MFKQTLAILAAGVFGAGLMAGQTRKSGASCNRACLESLINQYLDAMVAHNPFGLPLASKIRFTENEQVLPFGDGIWNNVTALGKYKLYVSDPQDGQAGFLGTLKENDSPVMIAIRLKVENRRIAEIETLVVRDPRAATTLDEMTPPDPAFTASGPVARNVMLAAVNDYDNAIEQGNGDKVPFDSDCNRVQNATQTTNNPKLAIPGLDWNPFALGCKEQLGTKFFIEAVYPRRPVVIDQERGITFGFFMFQVPGDVTAIDSPGHGKFQVDPSNLSPHFIDAAELFKFREGKIWKIEAIQTNVPYGTRSPFFKDDWRKPKHR
jgi:hypothetical protein